MAAERAAQAHSPGTHRVTWHWATLRDEAGPARVSPRPPQGHVARPAQLDNAMPGPSAPLPPRPAATAVPSPFVQDGGAGGAASSAAAAAAVRNLRAARPPRQRHEAAERARL